MIRHIIAGTIALFLGAIYFYLRERLGPTIDLVALTAWALAAAAVAGAWVWLGDQRASAQSLTSLASGIALVLMAWKANDRFVPEHIIDACAALGIGITSTFLGTLAYLAWSPRPRMKR